MRKNILFLMFLMMAVCLQKASAVTVYYYMNASQSAIDHHCISDLPVFPNGGSTLHIHIWTDGGWVIPVLPSILKPGKYVYIGQIHHTMPSIRAVHSVYVVVRPLGRLWHVAGHWTPDHGSVKVYSHMYYHSRCRNHGYTKFYNAHGQLLHKGHFSA